MRMKSQFSKPLRASLLVITLAATLLVTLARAANAPQVISDDELGGAERYLAYLSTDKPIYRRGDSVYLRTVVLNAHDNTTVQADRNHLSIKIKSPKGDVVLENSWLGTGSAHGYEWKVPDDIAGGEYTAEVSSPSLGFPAIARSFDIRTFRTPGIKSQIQFTRDGYGPADQVNASISIERAEGGIPVGATLSAIARLDGVEIYRGQPQQVGNTGIVDTAFSLPAEINNGEGSLAFVIEDGGIVETASKSMPIVLNKIDITFFPESGELVAGLKSRVYFQALLANGKPADVKGYIVEFINNKPALDSVATFESTHEGRGAFYITPQQGKQYAAVFTAPSGITQPARLPDVASSGTVLSSNSATYAHDQNIELSIVSNNGRKPATVTLHKRNTLIDKQITDGSNTVTLNGKDAEGVLIATAWDAQGHPLAERLIYRQPKFALNVELQLSEGPFVPGAEVSVDIFTTDIHGTPIEAVVGLTVTDDTVLELIEKRQQAPRLPVMVHLENDVLDLADAHVYLDQTNPMAEPAIDLLLGTQGWRRFVLIDYPALKLQHPDKIKSAMAESEPMQLLMRRRQLAQGFAVHEPGNRAVIQANAILKDEVEKVRIEAMALLPDALRPDTPLAVPELQADAEPVQFIADGIRLEENIVEDRRIQQDQIPAHANEKPDADLAVADIAMAPPAPAGYIREFAFKPRANRKAHDRIDFTETLYWNTGIKTGARDGKATIKFSLSDSVTTFRVMADAFGRNGALGTGDAVIASVEPFYVSAKMPQHAVTGDTIELPVTMVNTTGKALENATLEVTGNGIEGDTITIAGLASGERIRHIVKLRTNSAGTFPVTIKAIAGPYTDTVTRHLNVQAAGFPISITEGGLLSSDTEFKITVNIPSSVTGGSIHAVAKVYPSPLASIEEALSALLRQPHGCFEQTSSTNYPLVMAQQYFDSHTGVDPAKIAQAQSLLKAGYKKLISFESQDNGYEWFGANPAHEALTAYGLMEFSDMAKVMQVDAIMIDRTRQWLLGRRDGNGGFKRNERALDSFGRAPAHTTNAYIVWSLLESGQNPESLKHEIAQVKSRAFNGNDSYIDALAANILFLAHDPVSAEILLKKLADNTASTGAVEGSTTSITASGGDSLRIETTSLALLAWLRNDSQWAAQVEHSVKWLFERSKSGRFGSTQSTVLALKAINAYDAARSVPRAPGAIQLYVNGKAYKEAVVFNTESKGAIELPDFSDALSSGQHTIELRMSDGSKMPFSLEVNYNTTLPATADTTVVEMTTRLSHTQIPEGEPLELEATISIADANVATPIAIIGIPAGLQLQHDQIKELIGNDSISAYEVRDSELVFYWRALKANETRVIPISLVAEIPGNYTAPASRIYPYYTEEQKHWQAGHTVEILAQ